jgi:hypothetical protein
MHETGSIFRSVFFPPPLAPAAEADTAPPAFKEELKTSCKKWHQLGVAIPLSLLTATAAEDAETTALAAAALLFWPLSFFDLLPLFSFFPVRVSGSSLHNEQSEATRGASDNRAYTLTFPRRYHYLPPLILRANRRRPTALAGRR